jgi:hypothetical protein
MNNRVRDNGWLVAIAIEFFWGETLYGMEESLRRLRKWRLITVSIPLAGLIIVFFCAISWPQLPSSSASEAQTLGRLEYKVESLDKELEQQRTLTERLVADMNLRAIAMVEQQGQIRAINQKLDLVGWLIGAAALAFVGQTFSYFYQLKLRKALRGIEKRQPEEKD